MDESGIDADGTGSDPLESDAGSVATSSRLPLPSDNPGTNLLIADIIVRGASSLFRQSVEKRVAKASLAKKADKTGDAAEEEAQELLDGRTLITTLGLYGASKLATRSVPGLLVVTGGLLAKTLYDRGKSRQRRVNDGVLPEDSSQN